MMNILVTAPYHAEGLAALQSKFGKVVYRPWKDGGRAYTSVEMSRLLKESSADALITEHDEVDETVIAAFPGLQFIGVCRGTPSNVAVKHAAEAGIPVFYTPARNAQAVAEMLVANVICFMRHTIPSIQWLEAGKWEQGAHTAYLQFKGNELAGKTVGMVGFGGVGQRVAELLQAFPCKIQFYDPYVQQYDSSCKQVAIKTIFETSDIVSIHLPVTKNTIGMIDGSLISLMKNDAIFVNTARASVVNRLDLLKALRNQLIRGAVLDVFDSEPPDAVDNQLIGLPNVFATPHTAGATFEVEDHHVRIMNKALFDWADSQELSPLVVNKEILTERVK